LHPQSFGNVLICCQPTFSSLYAIALRCSNKIRHPSLQFKPVKNGAFRSVRVSLGYRALGVPVDQGVQWFWKGSHADYDKLIN